MKYSLWITKHLPMLIPWYKHFWKPFLGTALSCSVAAISMSGMMSKSFPFRNNFILGKTQRSHVTKYRINSTQIDRNLCSAKTRGWETHNNRFKCLLLLLNLHVLVGITDCRTHSISPSQCPMVLKVSMKCPFIKNVCSKN